jgi:hypothetical protein
MEDHATPAQALAAVPVALAALSAPVLTGIVVVALIIVAALCWTISDTDRSQRLAMIIDATRGNTRRQILQPHFVTKPG